MSESSLDKGLSLAPLRALRFTAGEDRLGRLLCPPYDVIDPRERARLLERDPDNSVQIILPLLAAAAPMDNSNPAGRSVDGDPYAQAADTISRWEREGLVSVDREPALYVYEMSVAAAEGQPASVTRGLVGALELRDPEDGVILPHENTMAGPVADRLALMEATQANLEPIYLVYDGGGAASRAVAEVPAPGTDPVAGASDSSAGPESGRTRFLTEATTADGIVHRLWAITDADRLAEIRRDLAIRHALIADGHHRYATYLQLSQRRQETDGPGPWLRGLALLVDSSMYGPQVHAIHRVIPGLSLDRAADLAAIDFQVRPVPDATTALTEISAGASTSIPDGDFAVVVTDGRSSIVVTSPDSEVVASTRREDEPKALLDLDVSVLHRILIERSWGLVDNETTVLYAHSREEAESLAVDRKGVAVLLRPTPVDAVAAVAAAGARMPRKSTLFTPKPASGLVMRRFADQPTVQT